MESKSKLYEQNQYHWHLRDQNCPKMCHLPTISWVQKNFRKVSEMRKVFNSMVKTKFLDKNWVGKMPSTLKLGKNSQIYRILVFWVLGISRSKSTTPCQKVLQNIKKMIQKLFFKNLSKEYPLLNILSFRAVTRDGNLFGKRDYCRFRAFFTRQWIFCIKAKLIL